MQFEIAGWPPLAIHPGVGAHAGDSPRETNWDRSVTDAAHPMSPSRGIYVVCNICDRGVAITEKGCSNQKVF